MRAVRLSKVLSVAARVVFARLTRTFSLACAGLLLASARSAAARPAETEGRWRAGPCVIGGGLVGSDLGEGYYNPPESAVVLGVCAVGRYQPIPALTLGVAPSFTESRDTGGTHDVIVAVALPLELKLTVVRAVPTSFGLLLRGGPLQAWHQGQAHATLDGSPLRGVGGTGQLGVEVEQRLAAGFALRAAVLARLDMVGFENGNAAFANEGATVFGGFFEFGGEFSF